MYFIGARESTVFIHQQQTTSIQLFYSFQLLTQSRVYLLKTGSFLSTDFFLMSIYVFIFCFRNLKQNSINIT